MSMDSRLKKIEGSANEAGANINMMRMKISALGENCLMREDARGLLLEGAERL